MIVLCLLVVVAGCGASEQQEVAAVIRASDAALERSDFDGACSWMTERGRQRFLNDGVNAGARTCSEAYTSAAVEPKAAVISSLKFVPVGAPQATGIRVNGDTAVVSYSSGDRTRLRKIDGRWLIDSF